MDAWDGLGDAGALEQRRVDRLLRRHPDVTCHGPEGQECLYRGAEVLVPASGVTAASDALRRWTDRREDLVDAGVARFRLRGGAGAEVLDLAASGVGQPNHLLRGQPAYSGGPAGPPRVPTDPPPAPRSGVEGAPVVVAVLDTGMDAHPWFTGQPWYAAATAGADVAERLDADLDYRLDAQAGHGTFVAGVVRQAAPTATVVPVRVLGSDGVCDELDLVRALVDLHARTAAAGTRVDVLNLSLGGYRFDDRPSPLLAAALARFGRDTAVVAAAGNAGSSRPFWPAALKGVVGVGALDAGGRAPAWFSNTGAWVDAWAPGEEVASAFVRFDGPAGDGAGGVPDGIDPDAFDGFALWDGSSFAAPAVAGAVAARVAAGARSGGQAAWDLLHAPDARALPGLGVVVGAAPQPVTAS